MTLTLPRTRTVRFAAALFALLGTTVGLAALDEPNQWLSRMTHAVETISYEGTVVRISNGTAEALKVVHTISDGVVREKLVSQEGAGLEIIRNGSEVHCILPDSRSVLVQEWDNQSTLFSTLPSSEIRFGSEYDVAIVREDRIAGHKTVLIAIRPHDEFRFGHRVWLDIGTAFPLQTQLIGEDGQALEQVKFAEITLNKQIHVNDLATSYNIDNFTWVDQPKRTITPISDPVWVTDDLPPGFRALDTHTEVLPSGDSQVTHILFSDGLANVSVFVAAHDGSEFAARSRLGASNSYSLVVADHRVTVIGEVPAVTVERMAISTRLR